jgi:Flp pilus assembly protein TadD
VVLTVAFTAGAVFFRAQINLSPRLGEGEFRLGLAALEKERYDEALRWYLEAVRLRPNDAKSWYNLGVTYDRLGQQEKADAAFEKAWQLQPDDPQIKKVHDARRQAPTSQGAEGRK